MEKYSLNYCQNDLYILMKLYPEKEWNFLAISESNQWRPFMLEEYPNEEWNFEKLCNDDLFTFDLVQKYMNQKSLDWDIISKYTATLEEIENYPEYPWEWDFISLRDDLTWEFIRRNLDKITKPFLGLLALGKNKNITWEIIKNNKQIDWHWKEVQQNPNITLDIIRKEIRPVLWDFYAIALNPNTTWEDIEKNLDMIEIYDNQEHDMSVHDINSDNYDYGSYTCAWQEISTGTEIRIPFSFIKKNPDKHYCWCCISEYVCWQDVVENPQMPWNWVKLSLNENINWNDILNNLDKLWSHYMLSEREDITIDIVKNNIDTIDWNWSLISRNSGITMDDINNNLDLPWEWKWISLNENLTWQFVRDHIDKDWDWKNIATNDCHNDFKEKTLAARTIQKVWVKYWYYPRENGQSARCAVASYEEINKELKSLQN